MAYRKLFFGAEYFLCFLRQVTVSLVGGVARGGGGQKRGFMFAHRCGGAVEAYSIPGEPNHEPNTHSDIGSCRQQRGIQWCTGPYRFEGSIRSQWCESPHDRVLSGGGSVQVDTRQQLSGWWGKSASFFRTM